MKPHLSLDSIVRGDSLTRTLRFLGHRVIADNHIGDWGTQFGMIIYGYKNFLDAEAYQKSAVTELGRLYRLVSRLVDNMLVLARADAGIDEREALVAPDRLGKPR